MILLRAILEIHCNWRYYRKKITKETLKIYCQTVQRQNARLSQQQIKMSSLKDCIFIEVRRKNYTGLCRNIVVENITHVFLKLKPTVTFEFVYNIPPTVINCGQN